MRGDSEAGQTGCRAAAYTGICEERRREREAGLREECSQKAAKRRLKTHKGRYSGLKLTILGDDLFSQSFGFFVSRHPAS
jgi:hypothetical protein